MKNLDTLFPFYDSLEEQYRFRKGIDNVPLINVSDENLVPFTIRRVHNSGTSASIELWFYPTNGADPINVHGDDAGIVIIPGASYDYIYYTAGTLPAALPHEKSGYYMVVEDKAVS